ncbi:MAG: ribosome biogenesis GTP-binding protein YihA/YsxC [Myxococcota bacterium]
MSTPPTIVEAAFFAGATELAQLPPPTRVEVAFAGRSNVGKSSLINSLLNRRKLVRTSSTPGATRAINFFRVKLRSEPSDVEVDFVDLPGYGYAKRSKSERAHWGQLIDGFLKTRAGLRGVVVIVDIRRGLEQDDRALVEYLSELDLQVVIVATKIDKISRSKQKIALSDLKRATGLRIVGYSSTEGQGRDALFARMHGWLF